MDEKKFDFYARHEKDIKWEAVLLRLIAAPRPRKTLEEKLRERGCPGETAEELLNRFEELDLINDRAYALLYIDSKRDFGLRRLRDELCARGVRRDDIDDALDEACVDENDRALRIARQWSGQNGMTPQKLDGRLRRRGFSSGAIREAFAILRDEGAGCFCADDELSEDFPD